MSFSSFTHIFDINLVQKKLDSVVLNKVIAEDNIACACTNVDISLRIFLTLMVTNCKTERLFSQMKRIKKIQTEQRWDKRGWNPYLGSWWLIRNVGENSLTCNFNVVVEILTILAAVERHNFLYCSLYNI